ncbi:stage III sporulation protein AF [Peribacillus tepidiphilus]|uniref:stage III sporulation protein AF n=1 Tax=Peribacillus tepidiphilus TaxID=2652445 RepID=UPI0035B52E47
MDFLTTWITNIILFILLAIVVEMLLPNSSMQKYAKMVIGLLLIAIIITPIFKLLSTDFEKLITTATESQQAEKFSLENSTELKKKEIQAAQHAYILEQMAVQLRAEVEEELMEQYKMEIKNIDIQLKQSEQPKLPQDLSSVSIEVAPSESDASRAIETVSRVEISTNSPHEEKEEWKKIRSYLASKWGITEERIVIEGEKGGAEEIER